MNVTRGSTFIEITGYLRADVKREFKGEGSGLRNGRNGGASELTHFDGKDKAYGVNNTPNSH